MCLDGKTKSGKINEGAASYGSLGLYWIKKKWNEMNVWNVADCRMFVGYWFVNKKIATNPWRYIGDMLALNETIIRNWKVDLKIPYENVASYKIC